MRLAGLLIACSLIVALWREVRRLDVAVELGGWDEPDDGVQPVDERALALARQQRRRTLMFGDWPDGGRRS